MHRKITLLRMCSLKAARFGRTESPQVSPLPEADFLVNKRRTAPHRPRLSRGRGGWGSKMIAALARLVKLNFCMSVKQMGGGGI